MVNFVRPISQYGSKSFLATAMKALKKEGDSVVRELPNGTKVRYTRGANFSARGFGEKYSLYKEVTRFDDTRYVTNANVIGGDIYINEIFYINPNNPSESIVNNVSQVYTMNPGYSSRFDIRPFNSARRYPKELKKLLTADSTESVGPSVVSLEDVIKNYSSNADSNIGHGRHVNNDPPKIKINGRIPKGIDKGTKKLELPTNVDTAELEKAGIKLNKPLVPEFGIEDVVVDDIISDSSERLVISEKPFSQLFTKHNLDDVIID